MSEVLAKYREQFPAYRDVDDATLASGMFTKFYADKMSREEFDGKIGLTANPAVREPPRPPIEPIQSEQELTDTGLGQGSRRINAPAGDASVLAESGRSGQRVVSRNGRQYLTSDVPMKQVQIPEHLRPLAELRGGRDLAPRPSVGNPPTIDDDRIQADQLNAERAQLGEAPAQIRENVGYAFDDEAGYKRGFGPGYDVQRIQSAGPLKGELAFRKSQAPGEDPPLWTTVRAKGNGTISMGDLQSLIGDLLPTIGAGLGGAVGTAVPSPTIGTALGSAVGGYIGEIQRLNEGKRRGVIPPETTDAEIIMAASKRAGFEALGAAGGMVAYRLYKAFGGRGVPDIGMSAEQYLEAVRKAENKLPPAGQKLLTAADPIANTPGGARLAATEDKLTTDYNMGDVFRERAQAKETYGRGLLDSELPLRGNAPGDQAIGDRVRAAAPDTEKRLAGLGDTLHPDATEAGAAVRGGLKRAQDTAEQEAQAIYAQVDSKLAGQTVIPIHTDISANAYKDLIKGDVFKNLGEEDAQVLKSWFEGAYEKIPGSTEGEARLRPLTYDQLDRGLKAIRRAVRSGYRGEWNGELEMLGQLEENLVKDRARLISKLPDGEAVAADLAKAEGLWKDLKGQFRRTKINDWLKLNTFGGKAVGDEAAGARIFSDPETARVVGSVLKGPEYQVERDAVRAMMRWEIVRTAKGQGGDVSADALKRMVSDNNPTLQNFFSKAEIGSMLSPAALMKTRKAMGIKSGMDESKWFDGFFKDANPRNAQTTMDRLRRVDPAGAKDVQAMAQQRIYNQLTKDGEQATGRAVDPDKFEKFLDEPGRADWLAHVIDPGFGARLRMIAEAQKTLNPASQQINMPQSAGSLTGLETARRAGRVFLGALSRESRIYNNAVSMFSDSVRQRTAEALLSPAKFDQLLRAAQQTTGGRVGAAALGQYLLGESRDRFNGDRK